MTPPTTELQPSSTRRSEKPASTRPAKRNRGGTQPLPLSRADILRAALPLLERDGVDGLRVRAVADRLGISSPAVYHYFSGRDDLIDRLCEEVAAGIDLTIDPSTGWDDGIVAVVLSMDRTFARYPGVAQRVLPARRHSPASDHISRTVHQLLLDGGFEPGRADELLAALQFLFGGWLVGRRAPATAAAASADTLERSVRWLLAGAAGDRRATP